MKKVSGLVNLSIVPMRLEPAEQSEMVSQLLFGEQVEILETTEGWYYIRNESDNYCAWVDRKMIRIIENENLIDSDPIILPYPITSAFNNLDNSTIFLAAGSRLHHYSKNRIVINDLKYSIDPIMMPFYGEISSDKIVDSAYQFLHAPYLWGGKSILGLDCSGFMQLIFSVFKCQLPRDASQQVEQGELIDFLNEAKAGDLAFFENQDGRIIHVGLLINSEQIIHASGCVRIDNIDSHGIINSDTGEYSHTLRIIKRVIRG